MGEKKSVSFSQSAINEELYQGMLFGIQVFARVHRSYILHELKK